MSTVLDLGLHIGDKADVPIKPHISSARNKTFEGIPLTVQTDWSGERGMMAIGFVIYDINGSGLVRKGDVDYGSASNDAELYAIF